MKKLVDIPAHFGDSLEPSVQLLDFDNDDWTQHTKVASEAWDYIKDVQPKAGKRYILVIAMGAGEHWGCFLPGSKVLMADGSEKNIEDVEAGDFVKSHTGRACRVLTPMVKEWAGDLYTFNFASYGHPLACTEEHPIYVVRGAELTEARKRYYKQKEPYEDFVARLEYRFVEAKSLGLKDYVAVPFETREAITEELGDLDDAWLMGYYLGNGCGSKNYKEGSTKGQWAQAVFIVRESDAYTTETLRRIIEKKGHACSPRLTNTSDKALRIEFNSRQYIQMCKRHLGHDAGTKYISDDIMKMPPSWQRRFLAGYLQADGNQVYRPETRYHGALTSSTASRKLSQDLVKLCARLGYHCSSFAFKQHHTSLSAGNDIFENCYDSSIVEDLGDCRFFTTEKRNKPYSCYIDAARGYLLFPVKAVEVEEHEAVVHNLEVETDNSYCVNSIAVHNCNRNGDYFPEADLIKSYKNFETVFDTNGKIDGGALIYKHHKNKIAQGHPWFGTVAKAFYNRRMHRIELLLEVHGDKGQDIIERIDRGDQLAVSMGVRIPFDQCSACGNKAKTRKEYCEHMKSMLRKILPNGKMIYAINGGYDYTTHKKPLNFFDISVVFRPADPTGYMLKKVAEEDEEVVGSAEQFDKEASIAEKVAFLRKLSTIDKIIKGLPIAKTDESGELRAIRSYKPTVDKIVSQMPAISPEKVEALSAFPMNKILSTMSHHGIIMTTPEFLNLVVRKLTGMQLPTAALHALARLQGDIFAQMAEEPECLDEFENYDMFRDVGPDASIGAILDDIKDSRDLSEKGIVKKAATDLLRSVLDLRDAQYPWGDGKGMLHSEYVTDPATGKRYAASMTAIEDAQWWENIHSLMRALGPAALLGGAYLYLKSKQSPLAPVAGLAALALGAKRVRDASIRDKASGYYISDSGTVVPRTTMMMEKKSALFPAMAAGAQKVQKAVNPRMWATLAPAAATALLHQYYGDRMQTGTAGTYRTDLEKDLDNAGRMAYFHPLLTGAAGMVGSHYALNAVGGIRRAITGK